MKKLTTLLILALTARFSAQDIRGAYLLTEWKSTYTYSVTLVLFTDASKDIKRLTVSVGFGDSTTGLLTLADSLNSGGVNIKTYSGTHKYTGPGQYLVTYYGSYRVAGINNILSSQTQQVYVAAKIVDDPSLGTNCPATAVGYPLNLITSGNELLYYGVCADCDADSVAYSLVNISAPGYYLPNGTAIDKVTGLFSFPKNLMGLYTFKMNVEEWRKDQSGQRKLIATSQMDFLVDNSGPLDVKALENRGTKLTVYPNPVLSELNVLYNGASRSDRSVEIYNSLGELVLSADHADKLNVSELSKGIYVLRLRDKNIPLGTNRFVKD